ncbi:MAG: polyprenyl synthetase family protein [Prevotellaceae bacterium]|nr:polyprenyl synthetase family protein [Prevotellaceae bacterium]
MIIAQSIKEPIAAEYAKFSQLFETAFQTSDPILKQVYAHLLSTKGKQIRPVLTLLSAKLCGEVHQATYFAAIGLELLHTVSLIHDDVVDETLQRRGLPSINSAFSNKVAVLSGDYLLAQAFSYVGKFDDQRLTDAFTGVGKTLTEGELLQLRNYNRPQFDEKLYLNIIAKKTAVLFSSCMYTGAVSASATDEQIENLRLFGEYLGLCFQIKDDIFDYSNSNEIGKPTANDIREKKITLPLIYAYNNASEEEKSTADNLLKMPVLDKQAIDWLLNFAQQKGGIKYAESRMAEYRQLAVKQLTGFDNSEITDSLIAALDYIITRKK